jgi:nicotinate-nucleotide adenylyltransferase
MNSGLFGGTFNPLHNGHIDTLRVVRENFGLDRVYLIPCAVPPHKSSAGLAPGSDRLEMINASIRDIDGFFSSAMELERGGPSYTIDTVKEFKKRDTDGTITHLIIGSDAFLDITTWERYSAIFEETPVIVMTRPGSRNSFQEIAEFIQQKLSSGYCFSDKRNAFVHDKGKQNISVAEVPLIDISSTRIRELVSSGKPFGHLVPGPVEQIIVEKGLYV